MPPGGGPSPWRNPRILFILFLIFLAGSAAGALAMRYSLRTTAAVKPPPSWKEGGKEIALERFKKELSLSQQQAEEVALVLDDFMMYYQTLQAQMDEVRASGKDRILKVLSPEQREKFLHMMSDLQAKQIR